MKEFANINEETIRSMGIRVAKGIFATCAHSVSEQIMETSDPVCKYFRREKVYVEGKLANVLVSGSAAAWNEDIALLQAHDDWAEMDLGSIAAVRRELLEKYRVNSLFLFADFRVYFRYNYWALSLFYHDTDSRDIFSLASA